LGVVVLLAFGFAMPEMFLRYAGVMLLALIIIGLLITCVYGATYIVDAFRPEQDNEG
jgi:hypothetical protein